MGLRVAVAAWRSEELDVADDAVGGALLAVFLVDLVLQAAVDGDEPAFGEDFGGGFAGVAVAVDVDVAGLVASAAAHAVDGDAHLADAAAVAGEFLVGGVGDEPSGAVVVVHDGSLLTVVVWP